MRRLLAVLLVVGAVSAESQDAFLQLQMEQVHLHPPAMAPVRPIAPQAVNDQSELIQNQAQFFGGQARLAPGASKIPPMMYFTSPYDYEADDAANPTANQAPDTWFDRINKVKDIHKRTYNAVSQGLVPRMGWMGTGLHRPINPLIEAQELSDIDPWRQLATQRYAWFRSPTRNPEIRGETLRRLQKSEVVGFDHTNGQYGVPLGTGLRGVGAGVMGLTKFDYGPFGLGPLHPNPLAYAAQSAIQGVTNQIAAPFGAQALLGANVPMMFL